MANYTDNATMTTSSSASTILSDEEDRLLGAINLGETIKDASVLAFYIFLMIVGLIGNAFVLYIYKIKFKRSIFLMIVGLIGNAFVLYIYKIKFKRSSARTYMYIFCLALLDFLVCCVGLPYHALDLKHLITYHHTTVSQALSYLSGAVNLGSVFVLMVVAVDRFLKVC